ncbi:MAG TPA: helix-turn-helix transcriptional regulator [Mucilaginibacter sp.]|jgi:transcriptional regulator with XRE-family HTH domain
MLDSIKSAEVLKAIGEKLYLARMSYSGPEGKKRSLGKPGISLRDLADVAKVKHTQIDAIEKGKSNATILTLIAITDVLGVDLCELLNYKPILKKGRTGKK